ncbi:DUF221-domain-containing protein [Fomitiporia mediterranea MF3/22]|uniref:DUF221-domain-containing protein n=1 Tax=Fomitiporia mediterranea (strain MF3/22) TaxID=694068 RepID=UPI0004407A48|nr:DUF221-domain-containing protein [Fomitiporia mediterranea MF3/22]EJC99291.1 DUF221-domain-containing protein [Fomitiporia mediterranea MF3/22]
MNAAIFAATVIAFSLLRLRFRAIYEPRTYVPKNEDKRSPELGKNPFKWPYMVWKENISTIRKKNSMDCYMFARFLRMMVQLFIPIWVISWAVLLPVDSVNSGSNRSGLERFTFGNVGKTKQERYWAHLSLAWVFTIWIGIMIHAEMRHYITKRQDYLVDRVHSASAQANTILVTGIRDDYLNEPALTHIFSHLPGGVRKIWFNRDLKELPDIYDRRMEACDLLEKAETKLVKKAIEIGLKKGYGRKSDKKSGKKHRRRDRRRDETVSYSDREPGIEEAEKIVPKKDRPTHRLPLRPLPFSIPCIGRKVDTIKWAREEIAETTKQLERGRKIIDSEKGRAADDSMDLGTFFDLGLDRLVVSEDFSSDSSDDESEDRRRKRGNHDDRTKDSKGIHLRKRKKETYPVLNSAFVLFNQQIGAHLAVQALLHHEPFRMTRKYIEVAPADVIWGNMGLNLATMRIRTIISYIITAGLIVLWSFPVAIIGGLSNISSLCQAYSWLAWLCNIPHFAIGVIQGMLPAIMLAALMKLLPVILRLLARFEGMQRKTSVELSLMTRFFIFQVVHSFLIVTLSSGLIAALPELVTKPTSIPSLLARQLPQASNFFLTYIILQGLTGSGTGYLQIKYFVLYYLKRLMAGSTPRSLYNVEYSLQEIKWGTEFPATTLIAVISIAYMIISPIINGLALATFFLLLQMYKYRFLYQVGQPAAMDTGGLFFPQAIQHVCVGLYIQQICLCTLFFLARDEKDEPSATPQGILMLVLILITIVCHDAMNRSYNKLLGALPLTKADDTYKNYSRHHHKHKHHRQKHGSDGRTGRYNPTGAHAEAEFYHPAAGEPIRPIWIPKDRLGLMIGQAEVGANRRYFGGKQFSGCHHANMDEKGHVHVTGHPPGGPWRDGDYGYD